MARKPATEAQRQAVRRRLQKAAADLYAQAGAGGVSARAIAERAEMSVGSIYSYFGSLQGLMQSLWMGPVEQINIRLGRIAEEVDDPVARLRALLAAYVDIALEWPELYRGAFLFVRPEGLPKPVKGPLESPMFPALLMTALREGQATGAVRPGETRLLAQVMWAGLHGCLALPINFDRLALEEPRGLADEMIEVLIANLAP